MTSRSKDSLPKWLHKPLLAGESSTSLAIKKSGLCTVCEEARCPNLPECYREKRATFMLLGSCCTRACGFCGVQFSRCPEPPDPAEPDKIASCCHEFSLRHVVLTMVTRDDLCDGGANHMAAAIRAVRAKQGSATVEVLTSDFGLVFASADIVLHERPEVFAHNIETVRSLSPLMRSKATYDGSLSLLAYIKETVPSQVTKSSLMVGLGETVDEVFEALKDLSRVGVDMVTIGQYLRPTEKHVAVREWIHPDVFVQYEEQAKKLGITEVVAGPFVRSSYQARPLRSTYT